MVKNEKQTVGVFFQEVRKEKGISIDEIVRETNMSKKYLESIEADNFSVFPGETYAMGFIANYADALEVARDTALSLYKRQMQIEQDSPIEQLVGKKKQQVPVGNPVIIVGVVVGVLLLIIILTQLFKSPSGGGAQKNESYQPVNYMYNFNQIDKIVNQKFRIGDLIGVSNENRFVSIKLLNTGAGNMLNMKINNNEFNLKSGEHLDLDSDGNGTNDMEIEVFSVKSDEVQLTMKGIHYSNEPFNGDDIYNKYKQYVLSETEFFIGSARTPVALKLSASANCWVSYVPDGKDEKQSYLAGGAVVNIPFETNLVLYTGNAGVLRLAVGGKEEVAGGDGEVGKSIFFWRQRNSKFVLVRALLK